jgi:hypothetical protein
MKEKEIGRKNTKGLSNRQEKVWKIYNERNKSGRHKMEPIPVCYIPEVFKNEVYIYALRDPDSQEIRYIGKSLNPWKRLSSHIKDKDKTPKTCWIHKLLNQHKKPILDVLDKVKEEYWKEVECLYIAYYKKLGHPLLNMTEGGDSPAATNKRAVVRIDPHTEERKIFSSVAQAAREIGLLSYTRIIACCNGKGRYSGEYKWEYVDKTPTKVTTVKNKQVLQIDYKSMKIVKIYKNVLETKNYGYDPANIYTVCIGDHKSAYGFLWRFSLDGKTIIQPVLKYKYTMINKYIKSDIFVDRFLNAEEAAKSCDKKRGDLILRCCRNGRCAYGYKWKFNAF